MGKTQEVPAWNSFLAWGFRTSIGVESNAGEFTFESKMLFQLISRAWQELPDRPGTEFT